MPTPRGTRQVLGLRDVARLLSVAQSTVKSWWLDGKLIGRACQARVVIPVEVVEFYLRYFRLPTKLELFEARDLSREFLLDLNGPDGGLRELVVDDHAAAGSDSGRFVKA